MPPNNKKPPGFDEIEKALKEKKSRRNPSISAESNIITTKPH